VLCCEFNNYVKLLYGEDRVKFDTVVCMWSSVYMSTTLKMMTNQLTKLYSCINVPMSESAELGCSLKIS